MATGIQYCTIDISYPIEVMSRKGETYNRAKPTLNQIKRKSPRHGWYSLIINKCYGLIAKTLGTGATGEKNGIPLAMVTIHKTPNQEPKQKKKKGKYSRKDPPWIGDNTMSSQRTITYTMKKCRVSGKPNYGWVPHTQNWFPKPSKNVKHQCKLVRGRKEKKRQRQRKHRARYNLN